MMVLTRRLGVGQELRLDGRGGRRIVHPYGQRSIGVGIRVIGPRVALDHEVVVDAHHAFDALGELRSEVAVDVALDAPRQTNRAIDHIGIDGEAVEMPVQREDRFDLALDPRIARLAVGLGAERRQRQRAADDRQ